MWTQTGSHTKYSVSSKCCLYKDNIHISHDGLLSVLHTMHCMYFQCFWGTNWPIYQQKLFGCAVGSIHTPIQGLLRAPTPGQHLWVNTQMNLMLQQDWIQIQLHDFIHCYYVNMDKTTSNDGDNVLMQSFKTHTARDQCEQDVTAELHLLYRETANNCQLTYSSTKDLRFNSYSSGNKNCGK